MALDANGNYTPDVSLPTGLTVSGYSSDPVQGMYGRPISDPNWAKWLDMLKAAAPGGIKAAPGLPSSDANAVNPQIMDTPLSSYAPGKDLNAAVQRFKNASNVMMGLKRAANVNNDTTGNENVGG